MANGPTRFGQPKPETLALLEKLGSPNSHNCRSDQCVVAAKANIYGDRVGPIDPAAKAALLTFAKAAGYSDAEYYRGWCFGETGGKILPDRIECWGASWLLPCFSWRVRL